MENKIEKYVGKLLSETRYLEYDSEENCYIHDVCTPSYYRGVNNEFLKEAFRHGNCPRQFINDQICDYETNIKDELIHSLLKECKEIPELANENEEDIFEHLTENVNCYADKSYMWDDKVTSQIVLQVEDEANHEFVLNTVSDGELLDGSIKWLIEQQGYDTDDFMKLWNGEESNLSDDKFLRSIAVELENTTTYTNKLTILTRMSLESLVDWNEFLLSGLNSNEAITVPKNTTIGLVDTWNGAGSCLEIELKKDLVIPVSNIYDVKPDAYYKHSVEAVYGTTYSFWKDIEIPVPKVLKKAVQDKLYCKKNYTK